jgi:glutamine amidotransferase
LPTGKEPRGAQLRKVAIVDYSIGNLYSVVQACKAIEVEPILTSDPQVLKNVDAVILPGVGAFAKGMENLKTTGLDVAIREHIKTGKPFFGVCLGMQLLCSQSEEFQRTEGLGVIKGRVTSFRSVVPEETPVPQVMWNEVTADQVDWRGSPLEETLPGTHFYFVHSFYCTFDQPVGLTSTEYYGHRYSSSVLSENVFATQFHPEKSGRARGREVSSRYGRLYQAHGSDGRRCRLGLSLRLTP